MAIPIKAVLSVSAKGFNVGIKGASKALGGLVALTKMATFAIVGLTAAFTAIVVRQAAVIDRLGKVSKVTGVAAETLQKFQFAAELAGVSSDQAAVALRRFSRRLGEAQKGTGELAPTLRRLGINLRDTNGQFKTAEQVLFELADGIANTEGESAKLSIAFKAFDSEGAELVNTLSKGGDALQEVFNRAEALGFVLTTSSIQGVEDFNDAFKELTTLIGGVTNALVANLAPALELITNELTDFLIELGKKFGGVDNLGEALAVGLIESIMVIIDSIGRLESSLIGFINGFRFYAKELGFVDQTEEAKIFAEQLELIQDAFRNAGAGARDLDTVIDKFNVLAAGARALSKSVADTGGVGEGMTTEQTEIFLSNMQEISDVIDSITEKGRTGILGGIQDDIELMTKGNFNEQLEENFALLELAFKTQVKNSDEIKFQYEKYRQILAVLEKSKFLILGKKNDQEEITEETEKELTFREKILEAVRQTAELFDTVIEGVAERLGSPLLRLQKTLEDGLVKGVEMFETALTDAILTGKADFSDLGDHLKRVLAQALVQKFITGPILALFGLAKGGPAKAGQPYIVGEEGPELFIPNQSGTVVPNHALGGMSGGTAVGGMSQTVNYNIQAVDAPSFQQLVARDPEFIFNVSRAGARRTPQGGF